MLSNEDLLKMSIPETARAIEDHHRETTALYESLASKIKKRTDGEKTMGDDKVSTAEYWLKVAKEQRKILSMDFDLDGFEESVTCFKFMSDLVTSNGNLSVKLKTARDTASKDCLFFCSIVRKAIQLREKDPVFALVLEKEPNPRKAPASKSENGTPAPNPTPAKSETVTPAASATT